MGGDGAAVFKINNQAALGLTGATNNVFAGLHRRIAFKMEPGLQASRLSVARLITAECLFTQFAGVCSRVILIEIALVNDALSAVLSFGPLILLGEISSGMPGF